jgi:hypothetical protein
MIDRNPSIPNIKFHSFHPSVCSDRSEKGFACLWDSGAPSSAVCDYKDFFEKIFKRNRVLQRQVRPRSFADVPPSSKSDVEADSRTTESMEAVDAFQQRRMRNSNIFDKVGALARILRSDFNFLTAKEEEKNDENLDEYHTSISTVINGEQLFYKCKYSDEGDHPIRAASDSVDAMEAASTTSETTSKATKRSRSGTGTGTGAHMQVPAAKKVRAEPKDRNSRPVVEEERIEPEPDTRGRFDEAPFNMASIIWNRRNLANLPWVILRI